ncbi:hypothetical protein [Afipia sp. DC4300-2b1]|uniref:hypothetical protein n=1 Tax=Afipia sp. DC4300-2b1 TaxID=2804672 RepID=UPI003CEA5548
MNDPLTIHTPDAANGDVSQQRLAKRVPVYAGHISQRFHDGGDTARALDGRASGQPLKISAA